jgi:alpha-L-fucosidase 2
VDAHRVPSTRQCDVRRDDPAAAFVPSYSPENAPANTGSQACANATMDVAVVRDLLRNLLAATAEPGVTDPAEPARRDLLRALPRYRIGADGELSEWAAPGYVDNHEHRHASHLYPLWYEPDPAIVDDPVLHAAAARTVRRRLEFWRGDRSGWWDQSGGRACSVLDLRGGGRRRPTGCPRCGRS